MTDDEAKTVLAERAAMLRDNLRDMQQIDAEARSAMFDNETGGDENAPSG